MMISHPASATLKPSLMSDRSKYVTAKSTTVDGGNMNKHGPQFAIDNKKVAIGKEVKTFLSTRDMKAPWIEVELTEMVTISGLEVIPLRTGNRYFQKVQIRGGPTSLSAQQDDKSWTVDTSQTFFAKYLGPHSTNGEIIYISLHQAFAAKFVSFQSELTSIGSISLSLNEVKFLQGKIK